MKPVQRQALETYLNQYLDVGRFRDYSPNGLQVEGREQIGRVVTGVTASLELITAASAAGADAIIVHHGYFWRGEEARIVGMRRRRIALLLDRNVNLFAFHLPLDAHVDVGNNAALAAELGFSIHGQFGEQGIGFYGEIGSAPALDALARSVEARLGRKPLVVGDGSRAIRRIAWCTGAAQSYIEEAAALGVDAFLTGEASEQTVHVARESEIAFIAAGHHATERYGVQALGAHLALKFGIDHRFIDVPNPV